MASDPTGYSGTPLATKLGYKAGMRVWFANMPETVAEAVASSADGPLSIEAAPSTGTQAAHIFVTDFATLSEQLDRLVGLIDRAGMIWVSWPKKAAKVASDITENRIREAALPLGLVDVKVCAIDDTWSGLKLVIRKELR